MGLKISGGLEPEDSDCDDPEEAIADRILRHRYGFQRSNRRLLTAIADALRENSRLLELALETSICDRGADAIADALLENSTLQHLQLRLMPGGAAAVVSALRENSAVVQLDLSGSVISDPGDVVPLEGGVVPM